MSKDKTRKIEEKMARLFSEKKPFSENLFKWEDPDLPDKYDHNCFEYIGQPTREEFERALAYQKGNGAGFIKLEGDEPLEESFGLEPSITLTMELKTDHSKWDHNSRVYFGEPPLEETEKIELKHYGQIYGEDFARRNICRLYEKLKYHGAYIDNDLVAICYSFRSNGMICIDGLLVDEEYRNQHIATSLLKHLAETNSDCTMFLHAEADDSPMKMYLGLGFEITDRLYEYICMNIGE